MRKQVQSWLCSVRYGSGVAVSCGVGCRGGLDRTLLWLWGKLATTAPIQPLAWDLPHAMGTALKRPKKKKKIQPSQQCAGICSLSNICYFLSSYHFSNSHSIRYGVISHCGFDLLFLGKGCWTTFHVGHLVAFFGKKNDFRYSSLNQVFCFTIVELYLFFICFGC